MISSLITSSSWTQTHQSSAWCFLFGSSCRTHFCTLMTDDCPSSCRPPCRLGIFDLLLLCLLCPPSPPSQGFPCWVSFGSDRALCLTTTEQLRPSTSRSLPTCNLSPVDLEVEISSVTFLFN